MVRLQLCNHDLHVKAAAACGFISHALNKRAYPHLSLLADGHRGWEALQACTRCSSLAVLDKSGCLMLAGAALPVPQPWTHAALGTVGLRSLADGRGNYLANLALYPGGVEISVVQWA